MDMHLISQGLKVSAFGLGGVFFVLILFYCATKLMLIIANRNSKQK